MVAGSVHLTRAFDVRLLGIYPIIILSKICNKRTSMWTEAQNFAFHSGVDQENKGCHSYLLTPEKERILTQVTYII